MRQLNALEFAFLARLISAEAQQAGLTCPAFRSPPKDPNLTRSMKRTAGGGFTIAVSLSGRNARVVAADMVDGLLAGNEPQLGQDFEQIGRDLLGSADDYLEKLLDDSQKVSR